MRYLIKFSYDGSQYNGFQRLNNLPSVQKELERVLSIINKKQVEIKGAGRTDALVHALGQCAHFDLDKDFNCQELKKILNKMLSENISISDVKKVDDNFHARFMVKEKTYIYKIYMGEKNPFYHHYAYCLKRNLQIEKMKWAAKLFEGHHNFKNFVSGYRDSYEGVINYININKDRDFVIFELRGKSFYRYMVRSIVGALIEVGLEKVSKQDIQEALDGNKEKRFLVAPAQGLYLANVEY